MPCFAVLTAFLLVFDNLSASDFLLFKTQNNRLSTFGFYCLGAWYDLGFLFWAICSGNFGCFVFDLAVLALFSILLLRTFRSFFPHFSCSEFPNNWLSSSIVCFTSFVENLLISLQVKFVSVSVSHLKYRLWMVILVMRQNQVGLVIVLIDKSVYFSFIIFLSLSQFFLFF